VRQPTWGRSYLAPSRLSGETQHTYALEILADILGNGATSRLYQSLVVEGKFALSAGAYYGGDDRGPGSFGLYAILKPGVSMQTLETKIAEELSTLLESGITESELARAKKRMQAQAIFARDSLSAGARILGAALAIGLTVEDVESWPERIGAVTTKQILAAAKAVLKDSHSVTSYLLAKKTG
ncbi:MAG: insulinase family protein, partial [Alphaproteobacteria bacterium]|nr:insulinase family protein [Alphaproteobacteria bacterium]